MPTRRELEIALERAQKAGDDDFARQVARQLGGYGLPPLPTQEETIGELGRSANRELLGVAGLPVDVTTMALNLIPGVDIERPVGGSEQLKELVPPPSEDPELAGAQRIGSVIGGSLPFLAAPYAGLTEAATAKAAQQAATRNLVNQANQTATRANATLASAKLPPALGPAGQIPGQAYTQAVRESATLAPTSFLAAETSSLGGAAALGGVAADLEPDSEIKPLVMEVVGGTFHPLSLAIRLGLPQAGRLTSIGFRSMTEEGRKDAARELLFQRLTEMGENPAEVQRILSGTRQEFGESTAVASGSSGMLAIERSLMRDSRASNELRDQYRQSWQMMNEAVDSLIREGSPEALRMAARLRRQKYEGIITARIAEAERLAKEAVEQIRPDRQIDVDVRAREIFEEALDDGRASERQLWSQIDKEAGLAASNVVGEMQSITDETVREFLPGKIPPPVRRFIDRVREGGSQSTAGELLSFRSEVLDAQRTARGKQEWGKANVLGRLADAALEDLSGLSGNEADMAREFSRALNDKFTRGPVGRLLRLDPQGAPRVAEELTLSSTVGQGATRGALNVRAQQEAVTPIRVEGFSMLENNRLDELASTQEQTIREMVNKTLRPDGTVDPGRLAKWRDENRALLDDFPELDRLTQTAHETREFASAAMARAERVRQVMDSNIFYRLLETEQSERVFSAAMKGPNPRADMRAILRRVRTADESVREAAQRGARSAFLESAISQTRRNDGSFDGEAFKALINQYGDDLIASGVLNRAERARLVRAAEVAARTDRALRDPRKLDELFASPSALEDMVVSVLGAKIGQSIAGRGIGSSLVLAGRGASILRNKLRSAPIATMQEIMTQIAKEPDFAAAVMRRPSTREEAARINRQINAYLFGSTLSTDLEAAAEE